MPPPPHMFMNPHHFGKHPPPPHFLPMFMPPPAHFYSPQPSRPAPSHPIIETIYDTYPRRGTYDESIYMQGGTLPPNSTYKPGAYNSDYEGFYDTYKRQGKNGVHSDSDNTSVDDSQFWDAYESGAYRKVNVNDKPRNGTTPKMNGEKSPAPQKSHQIYGESAQSKRSMQHSTPKIEPRQKQRPTTPGKQFHFTY